MAERNLEAEQIYADAWRSWVFTSCPKKRACLEAVMDGQQERIATSPSDPRWNRFTRTLPGFREFWSRVSNRMREQFARDE